MINSFLRLGYYNSKNSNSKKAESKALLGIQKVIGSSFQNELRFCIFTGESSDFVNG
jgi:hypothetical protein